MKKRGRPTARKPVRRPSGRHSARSTRSRTRTRAARARPLTEPADAADIDAIRDRIAQVAAAAPARWNADPENVKRSVLKLVLTLVELIRQLLERQAIRRMDHGTLTATETEAVGLALMRLQETILELATQFDIDPNDLNLDLGPIGKLM